MYKLTSDCKPGITRYTKNTTAVIIDKTEVSEFYSDNVFLGSFCPQITGAYRIILEGSLESQWENLYSIYRFNNIETKNRTSPYQYIFANTCYMFLVRQSISYGTHDASLYYQKDTEEKALMTSATTYSCNKVICLKGSKDPKCIRFNTCRISTRTLLFCIRVTIFVICS